MNAQNYLGAPVTKKHEFVLHLKRVISEINGSENRVMVFVLQLPLSVSVSVRLRAELSSTTTVEWTAGRRTDQVRYY